VFLGGALEDSDTEDNTEGDVQKKIMPWRLMIPDEEVQDELEYSNRTVINKLLKTDVSPFKIFLSEFSPPKFGILSIREVTTMRPPSSLFLLLYSSSSCTSSSGIISLHGIIFHH
jgi:hypothetical protein